MRVKFRTTMAAPWGVFQPGDVAELTIEEALPLIKAEAVEALDPLPDIQPIVGEVAVEMPGNETADKFRKVRRK